MKHFRQHPAWQFIDKTIDRLPDPRVSIAILVNWSPIPNDHRQTHGVEPDNYNFAVYDSQAHDLNFIENSVFYRSQHISLPGWFSVYVIEEKSQIALFNQAMIKIQPQAVWRYQHAHPVRSVKTILPRESSANIRNPSLTVEERLWQTGYYEKLQSKYFDGDEKFITVIGKPRGFVLEVQPEDELHTDYSDN